MFEKNEIVKLKVDRWTLGFIEYCTNTHAFVSRAKFLKGINGKSFGIEYQMKVPLEQLERCNV